MKKIRKDNKVLKIKDEQLNAYLKMGYKVVETKVLEPQKKEAKKEVK